jgi:hypothetical protein
MAEATPACSSRVAVRHQAGLSHLPRGEDVAEFPSQNAVEKIRVGPPLDVAWLSGLQGAPGDVERPGWSDGLAHKDRCREKYC